MSMQMRPRGAPLGPAECTDQSVNVPAHGPACMCAHTLTMQQNMLRMDMCIWRADAWRQTSMHVHMRRSKKRKTHTHMSHGEDESSC